MTERGATAAPENGGARSPDPAELRALLHLAVLPGIGIARMHAFLRRYGSARGALGAPAVELGAKAARARGSRKVRGRVARALETIERLDLTVLLPRDPRYPDAFSHLHDPPYVVFARGRLELLERDSVAIVGSRRCTDYGAAAARLLAEGLARAGLVVVSGMARGIDGHAHEAALASGTTVGVLGCGVDVVYPARHDALYRRIGAEGLLLSEFVPGEPALPHHFPRRNRLIAALARGVIVVEAAGKSGALITADHALDLGREVMAVPGPIGREASKGTNRLIREGAALVRSVEDALEVLRFGGVVGGSGATVADSLADPPADPPPGLSDVQLGLWRELELDPLHVDELARRCDLSPAAALGALLELELRGHVRQLAGARFAKEEPRSSPRRRGRRTRRTREG